MSTTNNPYKNRTRRRAKKMSARDKYVAKIATQVVDRKVTKQLELKHYDRNSINGTISASGNVYSLSNLIAQGGADDQRNGDEITLQSISGKMFVYSGNTGQAVRAIILRWNAGPITSPTLSTVLQDSATIPFVSAYHRDYMHNFQVLYDNIFAIASGGPDCLVDKFFIKLRGKASWMAGGGTSAQKGHLYLILVSNAVATLPVVQAHLRLKYLDG